jgi:glycosyltransferase involved in cell wall biosynthesis
MRTLVVSHTAAACGSNAVILGLLRHRPADLRVVCAFLSEGPVLAQVRALGVEASLIDAGRARDLVRASGAVLALAGLAHRKRVDAVFAHTSKAQIYASPAAMLAGAPSVWFEHEVPGSAKGAPGRQRMLQALAARLPARAVLCTSDYVAARHHELRPGAKVVRQYPGVHTEGVAVRSHGHADEIRLAVVGRLQRWKRVELALDCLKLALIDEPRLRLIVAGDARPDLDADYPAALRARADALGIAHAVDFVGDSSDPAATLLETDIMLHLSDGDSFGLMVVEAMLRGVPVIASSAGGPAEIVRDGVDGLLVEPTDVPALAGAVRRLARDPVRRAEMGAAGRARVLERFDERRTAADTWALMAALAAAPDRRLEARRAPEAEGRKPPATAARSARRRRR